MYYSHYCFLVYYMYYKAQKSKLRRNEIKTDFNETVFPTTCCTCAQR